MAFVRTLATACAVVVALVAMAAPAAAAPRRAEAVIDARTGELLHARDADLRLPPASLTKMMTLYLVFEAIERGRLGADQQVTVSAHAARQQPTKVGFRPGQRVRVRDLVRAAATRSANDAAVALAEAVAGSEARFADLMTRRAREIGMTNSTFRNATGFTANGHLSTARDMAHLGRRLFYDFPQYYDIFGRPTTEAFGRTMVNTNKLLRSYRGADGIKTGYTRAAGYNLVASAERGNKRVIAAYFGGPSSGARNERVAQLLDLGFRQAPARARETPPPAVAAAGMAPAKAAAAAARAAALMQAPAPAPRPASAAGASEARAAAIAARETAASLFVESVEALGAALAPSAAQAAVPTAAPASAAIASAGAVTVSAGGAPSAARAGGALRTAAPRPRPPGGSPAPTATARAPAAPGDWAVQLGAFAERDLAIAELAAAAFGVMPALAAAGREIHVASMGEQSIYRARLTGLDASTAREACRRIARGGADCTPIPPAGD